MISSAIIERMADVEAPTLMSKHMTSVPIERKPKTWVYAVISNHGADRLGVVRWHAQWRGYSFEPEYPTRFSPECMDAISSFAKALMHEHRGLLA